MPTMLIRSMKKIIGQVLKESVEIRHIGNLE
jgi:hypothetical protein